MWLNSPEQSPLQFVSIQTRQGTARDCYRFILMVAGGKSVDRIFLIHHIHFGAKAIPEASDISSTMFKGVALDDPLSWGSNKRPPAISQRRRRHYEVLPSDTDYHLQ